MIQIRDNVFETNSSSTHSLCISKEEFDKSLIPKYLNIRADEEFGWQQQTYYTPEEKANYLFQTLYDCDCRAEIEALTEKINNIAQKYNIRVSFPKPEKDEFGMYTGGYVDHAGEAIPFVQELIDDEDKLCRFLFNSDSRIYTGSDCVDEPDAACYVAEAAVNNGYVWGYDENGNWNNTHHIHPKYDPEHYEYFFKGN